MGEKPNKKSKKKVIHSFADEQYGKLIDNRAKKIESELKDLKIISNPTRLGMLSIIYARCSQQDVNFPQDARGTDLLVGDGHYKATAQMHLNILEDAGFIKKGSKRKPEEDYFCSWRYSGPYKITEKGESYLKRFNMTKHIEIIAEISDKEEEYKDLLKEEKRK